MVALTKLSRGTVALMTHLLKVEEPLASIPSTFACGGHGPPQLIESTYARGGASVAHLCGHAGDRLGSLSR